MCPTLAARRKSETPIAARLPLLEAVPAGIPPELDVLLVVGNGDGPTVTCAMLGDGNSGGASGDAAVGLLGGAAGIAVGSLLNEAVGAAPREGFTVGNDPPSDVSALVLIAAVPLTAVFTAALGNVKVGMPSGEHSPLKARKVH